MFPLNACETLQVTAPLKAEDTNKVACKSFGIIYYNRLVDDLGTIRQIKEHNAAYRALCPVPPAPKLS